MMSGTVNSAYTTIGLTLSSATQNPVTITQTGEINASSLSAIDGINLAAFWTIDNSGSLKDTHFGTTYASSFANGVAISFSGGGDVTNRQSGQIYGNGSGIVIAEAGSVTNFGTIAGGSKYGIEILGAGYVTNGSTGDISAHIAGNRDGIYIDASGSVTNFGTIQGKDNYGVRLGYPSHVVVINGSATDTSAYIGGDRGGLWGFGSGYVENYGTIEATVQTAIRLDDNVTIINGSSTDRNAIIKSNQGGVALGTGTLTNFGTIIGGPKGLSNFAAGLYQGGLIVNKGLIEGANGVLIPNTGTLINAGTIIGYYRYDIAVNFSAAFAGESSKLIVDPGAEFFGTVTGRASVSMELAAGARVGTISGVGTQFTDIKTIAIDAGASWIISGDATGLANGQSITGFSIRDTLVLDGFTATSSIVSDNALVLSDGVNSETLNISTDIMSPSFLISDVAQGTEISVRCYLRGTKILTPSGEVPVEALSIGGEVVTFFGGLQKIKWIGRQSFNRRFVQSNRDQLPVRIAAGALGRGLPKRDLFVSPGHSMLLGETLVLAKSLVNGITITQAVASEDIHYYLIEFQSHDCVQAEGVWSESFADGPGLRNQFHNVAEFFSLYPDYRTPDTLQLCAPRPECGPALAAALRPIVRRAAAHSIPGPLRGYIDIITAGRIEGWAQDQKNPELPVLLEVLANNRVIGTILACDYRADLAAAGIGQGRCHFACSVPARYIAAAIRVRRAADGREIATSDDCHNLVGKCAAGG